MSRRRIRLVLRTISDRMPASLETEGREVTALSNLDKQQTRRRMGQTLERESEGAEPGCRKPGRVSP